MELPNLWRKAIFFASYCNFSLIWPTFRNYTIFESVLLKQNQKFLNKFQVGPAKKVSERAWSKNPSFYPIWSSKLETDAEKI